MSSRTRVRHAFYMALLVVMDAQITLALDEGMWTFDNPPVERLRETYGFTPTAEWLEHVRLASVRINDGGSGAFVSPRGLVMTNHHVALEQVQKLSRQGANYIEDGFYAATTADELPCPDLEINVLMSLENVTERVRAAVRAGMSQAEALKARQAEIAAIEKESLDATGLRSNVVELYHGGEYWLYRYKRYTDVRLVMVPESLAAFFGGDLDNFTYPRYCLDIAFLRVYENGQPARTPHYLPLDPRGPAAGELIFVSGNPGSTDRLHTQAQLRYQRDTRYPVVLDYIDTFIELLESYGSRGREQERQARTELLIYNNSKKALTGELEGLQHDALMSKLSQEEERFRAKVASRAEWQELYGDAWEQVAKAVDRQEETYVRRLYRALRGSDLAGYALTLVRYVSEIEKPDAERLPGFHDSDLEALEFQLLSPAPTYPAMEAALLGGYLEKAREVLGPDDPFVRMTLQGGDPREVARALLERTELDDVERRRALLEGGRREVESSDDPLIVLARKLDPLLRQDETWYRENVESVLTAAGEKIAKARFAIYGKSVYPDATFTPRLAFGTVIGYPMNGTLAPYQTTLYGLYNRSLGFDRKGDFVLPDRFWARRERLDLATPVNFVSTADIIGGNSGSPVVSREGRTVGLVFDGNIESLVGRFAYDDTRARAVAVHPAYIIEALRELYDARGLVEELLEGPFQRGDD